MEKERLDVLLVNKGFYDTREKAKRAIMAGIVFVDKQKIDKAGTQVNTLSDIYVKEDICPYVSRGGLKLEKALKFFEIDLSECTAMDIGASTGGFTDCMLKSGAKKVYALDVGYGQLDWKLRNDPRVINMEKVNIRYVTKEDITEDMDFISIDVSFISLVLVLPVAFKLLKENGSLVCLVKPQFEAGRQQVGKNGIVRDKKVHIEVLDKITEFSKKLGFNLEGLTFSPVKGTKGNIEYLLYIKKYNSNNESDINVTEAVENAHSELQNII